MVTAQTVRDLALGFPNTEERLCYGMPAFYVMRKIFARLLEDDDTVVLKIDKDQRQQMMQADPDTYFITEHYRNYPMMIVRLSNVDQDDLRDLLEQAWQIAAG